MTLVVVVGAPQIVVISVVALLIVLIAVVANAGKTSVVMMAHAGKTADVILKVASTGKIAAHLPVEMMGVMSAVVTIVVVSATAVAMAVLPPCVSTLHDKYARFMGTPPLLVGGDSRRTILMMMMILVIAARTRKAQTWHHMG
jgi:hypothetical protein